MNWFLLVLLAVGLVVAALHWELAVLDPIIVALVLVLLTSWIWDRFSLVGIGFERSLRNDRVSVGESVYEDLTILNRSWIPKLWIEIDDRSTLPHHTASRVVSLGGKGAHAWQQQTVAVRRGRHRLGPCTISTGDPFGLFSSKRQIPISHELMVYPAKIDVSAIQLPIALLDGGRATPSMAMMTSAAFNSLREYSPGDPMSRISWSATARRGTLMVKEFDPDPTADLWLLLDLNDEGQFDLLCREDAENVYQHLDSTLEYILSIGSGLANSALAQGKKVGLILNRKDPIRIEPDNTERQWLRIAENLAVATSSGSRSITESIIADHRRFSRNSGLIVVTADPRSDWVAAGAALVERLVPVTAVIIDAGGEGGDDVSPLLQRLASARIKTHRYPTHNISGKNVTR